MILSLIIYKAFCTQKKKYFKIFKQCIVAKLE